MKESNFNKHGNQKKNDHKALFGGTFLAKCLKSSVDLICPSFLNGSRTLTMTFETSFLNRSLIFLATSELVSAAATAVTEAEAPPDPDPECPASAEPPSAVEPAPAAAAVAANFSASLK